MNFRPLQRLKTVETKFNINLLERYKSKIKKQTNWTAFCAWWDLCGKTCGWHDQSSDTIFPFNAKQSEELFVYSEFSSFVQSLSNFIGDSWISFAICYDHGFDCWAYKGTSRHSGVFFSRGFSLSRQFRKKFVLISSRFESIWIKLNDRQLFLFAKGLLQTDELFNLRKNMKKKNRHFFQNVKKKSKKEIVSFNCGEVSVFSNASHSK